MPKISTGSNKEHHTKEKRHSVDKSKKQSQPNLIEIPFSDIKIVNPGPKGIYGIVEKLRRYSDKEKRSRDTLHPHDKHNFLSKYDNIFESLRDYSRCAVLVKNFKEAEEILRRIEEKTNGKITIHNRDVYKAFHIHGQIDVEVEGTSYPSNFEIQFHTPESYNFKQESDSHYHNWRGYFAEFGMDKAREHQQFIEDENIIAAKASEVYKNTDFNKALKSLEVLLEEKKANMHDADNLETEMPEHICILDKVSEVGQTVLIDLVKDAVNDYEFEKIKNDNPEKKRTLQTFNCSAFRAVLPQLEFATENITKN